MSSPARHRRGATPAPIHRRWWLGAIRVLAAAVSITLLLGFAYGWYNYRSLNNNLRRVQIVLSQPSHPVNDGKAQNILVVGNDDRTNMTPAEVAALHTGSDGGSLATDTMMIVHVPADGSAAMLISLPRDAYVEIPGYGKNKLNSAYADAYTSSNGSLDQKVAAGANLLMQTVQDLTGLTMDHFVQVTLLGFYRISNAIGGVPINLCNAVDDSDYSGFKMSAGEHTVQGATALEFVRQRHGSGPNGEIGDIGRAARQRYFLTAAFRKISSAGVLLNPGRLSDLISAVDKSLYVDSDFDMLAFARQMSGLNANNIRGTVIPFIRFDTVDGVGSVEIVDPDQVRQFVADQIGQGQAVLGSDPAADPATVTLQVLNGGTENGAAEHSAELLRGYGFTATYSSAEDSAQATTIRYAKGMEADVKALLKYLPPNVVLDQADVPVLTLVLGEDGLAVKAPPGSAATGTPSGSTGTATPPAGTASPTAPATSTAAPGPIDAGCIN